MLVAPILLALGASGPALRLAILDRYLTETPYVAGKEISIGDIPVGILTYRFYSLPIERHRLPHLEAWYKRLGERPAYRQRIMIGLS